MFPPPGDHRTQALNLTLGDILGDECCNLATFRWERHDKVDLYLDHYAIISTRQSNGT